MSRAYYFLFASLCGLIGLMPKNSDAQVIIRGTVYDSSRTYPIEAVSVLSSSGSGTATDVNGHYQLTVDESDSIWFSYLNKPTIKFPVLRISNPTQFDISLHVNIPVLTEVKIRPRNYRLDSIRNRLEYEDGFNFQRPDVKSMTSIGPGGAGINIEELIRVFQFRKNKRMEQFRERLMQEEKDKFIDHRFNKSLVRRLTGFDGDILDVFMRQHRPAYEFTLYASDYDFQDYIVKAAELFRGSHNRIKKES